MKSAVKAHRNVYTVGLAFLIPALVMTVYFAYRKMEPFGSSTLMTVDLGQQYIDFFSYMRRSILSDPSSILYSFSNALGGGTIGIWAYYLLSPLNLLLLPFGGFSLPTGLLLLTVIKYGLASSSFSWMLIKTKSQYGLTNITFATSYALMGWMVANQFNIMWLDAAYLLPLVFYGLYLLMNFGKWNVYLIWLFISLIVNFYMAYMICIFMILSFIWFSADTFKGWKNFKAQLRTFFLASLGSGLLSAFLLLPTWWSLSQSKAQYALKTFDWKFDFFPPKMIAKLFSGAFNFSQVPLGTANIFIGAIALVGSILFFCDSRIPAFKRIVAGLITFFLLLSICFQPLDIFWHAGQFPIWYPYRFSFIVSFWLIWLAAQTLDGSFKAKPLEWTVTICVLIVGILYVSTNLKTFKFLSKTQIFISIMYILLAIGLILLPILFPTKRHFVYPIAFLLVGVSDGVINAVTSLNKMTYMTQTDYSFYTAKLSNLVKNVEKDGHGTYRIGKNFLRTKGDALQVGFNGGGVFSSVLPKVTADFYGKIGSPDSGGSVEYSNGTLLTDSLLSMKYYLKSMPNSGLVQKKDTSNISSNKADTAYYQNLGETDGVSSYKNRFSLPVGYAASDQILSLKDDVSANPSQFQANWLSALTGNSADEKIYKTVKFDKVKSINLYPVKSLKTATLKKKNPKKDGILILTFSPKTNDPYYFTFGPSMSANKGRYSLNGLLLNQDAFYRNPIMVSAASFANGQKQTLAIEVTGKKLELTDFSLLHLDTNMFLSSVAKLKSHPWVLKKQTNRYFSGTIKAPHEGTVLNTSVPYSKGWSATVNGSKEKTYKTIEMFTAIKLHKGRNTVTLSYWPPLLNLGLFISGITLCIILVIVFRKRD